ncbi:hypothetical protein [Halomarina rubra]|uniref:Uncharacterized protein n=1 Tax=Halomarina rubra TaxID=2071873 RepID=A0ABD6AWU0_9EURY|nr:hypothetical protein [Halomarina rubra]
MSTTDDGLFERAVLPTVDLLLAAFGLAVLAYPLVTVTDAALGGPLSASGVRTVVAVVAVGGAYPFVAGDWALGRLSEFVFVLTATALGVSACLFVVAVVFGTTVSTSDATARAIVVGLTYLVAALVEERRHRTGDGQ